jgi:hypothetical protein
MSASLDKADCQGGRFHHAGRHHERRRQHHGCSGAGNSRAGIEFKTYADNPEEQVQRGPDGYSGSKRFRTALVPVKPGQYRIDPVVMTYFDVASGRYRDLTTSAFELTVSPSETAVTDIDVFRAAPAPIPSLKKRVEFTGRDILPAERRPGRHCPPTIPVAPVVRPFSDHPGSGFFYRQRRDADHPKG